MATTVETEGNDDDTLKPSIEMMECSQPVVSRPTWLQHARAARPGLIILFTPLVLMPIPLVLQTKSASCGYVILVMAVYWATEALPLAVTALLPIAAMPWLGVASSKEVCPHYFDDANVMFFAGLMLALAVEKWNLHKRLALRVLMFMGSNPLWILLGFMMITGILSMWISNTGATAMLIPIAIGVLDELDLTNQLDERKSFVDDSSALNVEDTNSRERKESKRKEFRDFSACLCISIALSANVGGTATLIGCGPNIALAGLVQILYGSETGVNFISWLSMAFPTMLLNLLLSWFILALLFIGPRKTVQLLLHRNASLDGNKACETVFRREYEKLGPMTFAEGSVLGLFAVTVALWITRKPDFFPGWSELLGLQKYVTEGNIGISVCILMFMLPSRLPNYACFRKKSDTSLPQTTPTLLDWNTVHNRLPWGVVLLLGGGFALAFSCKKSGLSADISNLLSGLSSLPQPLVLVLIAFIGTVCSTFAGIIPTSAILLPIVAELGKTIRINPLALMICVAFSSSFTYILPVSTPPNAIVYAYARFSLIDMVKSGVILSVVHIGVLQLSLNTWGRAIFHLDQFPDWVT